MDHLLYCIILLFTWIRQNESSFGLTSETVLPDILNSLQQNSTVKFRDAVLLAQRSLLNLHKRESTLTETLADAVHLSSLECARQFEYDRWNCSLNSVRLNLLKKAYPETAFLYSITSASLVHTVSRACSSGKLRHCTCDEHSFNASENRKTWLWGGCGDNVKFGTKFTRKFLLKSLQRAKDLRALVERHNSEIGIKNYTYSQIQILVERLCRYNTTVEITLDSMTFSTVQNNVEMIYISTIYVVRRNVAKVCKCHGVSGSCTVRTCWKELSPFSRIGTILKRKYATAVKPNICNEAGLGRPRKRKRQRYKTSRKKARKRKVYERLGITEHSSLLYLEDSPNFCHPRDIWPDTKGRRCRRGIDCDNLCCGRGYNARVVTTNVSCKCRVIWCCTVNCLSCQQRQEIYTCK